jgi:hypothetical protein
MLRQSSKWDYAIGASNSHCGVDNLEIIRARFEGFAG